MRLRLLSIVCFATALVASPIGFDAAAQETGSAVGLQAPSSFSGGDNTGALTGADLHPALPVNSDENNTSQNPDKKSDKELGAIVLAGLIPLGTFGIVQLGQSDNDDGGSGAVIQEDEIDADDPISAEVVPEPSTWTLLAIGLGLVFVTARRRRRLA